MKLPGQLKGVGDQAGRAHVGLAAGALQHVVELGVLEVGEVQRLGLLQDHDVDPVREAVAQQGAHRVAAVIERRGQERQDKLQNDQRDHLIDRPVGPADRDGFDDRVDHQLGQPDRRRRDEGANHGGSGHPGGETGAGVPHHHHHARRVGQGGTEGAQVLAWIEGGAPARGATAGCDRLPDSRNRSGSKG